MKPAAVCIILFAAVSAINIIVLIKQMRTYETERDSSLDLINSAAKEKGREIIRLQKDLAKMKSVLLTLQDSVASVSNMTRQLKGAPQDAVHTNNLARATILDTPNAAASNDDVNITDDIEKNTVEARITALEDKMLSQAENPAWERNASEEIKTFFQELNADELRLEDIYCAGNICRFELSTNTGTTVEDLGLDEKAIVQWPHRGESFPLYEDSANPRRVYYLTRK